MPSASSFRSLLVVAMLAQLPCVLTASCAPPPDAPDGGLVDSDAGPDANLEHLHINEVLASNTAACLDEAGEADDFIELYNDGATDLPLDNYSLTDDRTVPDKAPLAGLVVPAGGVLMLWADDTTTQGANHLPFKLSAAAEEVVLFSGGVVVDEVAWTAALTDVALARFPDGSGTLVTCAVATCAAVNGAACGG